MRISWSMLRSPEPTALAAARSLAHRAAQWPARAAMANLAPLPDDGHAALAWDARRAALLTRPLKKKGLHVGLRVGILQLIVIRGREVESLALAGCSDAEAGRWLDGRLAKEGLEPASPVKLPYEFPQTLFGRPAEEAPRLAAVAGWLAAGADVLEELRRKYADFRPGPTPVRCRPRSFDMAMTVALAGRDLLDAKSISLGVSPGDEHYAQPYGYVLPCPVPGTRDLPPLPPGGRWHTRGFFGAVATATDLLALPDPRAALLAVIDAAFAESLRRFGPA